MSDISSKDGEDFKKPNDVNGSDADNLSVKGHPDNDTTNRSVHGDSDSSSGNSSSSNSGNSSSNNSSSSQSSSGNALTRLFNLNAIFDNKAS